MISRALATAAACAALVLPCSTTSRATAAPSAPQDGFVTDHRTDYRALHLASPGPGRLVVVGTRADQVVVETLDDGAWRSRQLPVPAGDPQVAVADGCTFVLARTGSGTRLWRIEGDDFIDAPLPEAPAPLVTFQVTKLDSDGHTLAVTGVSGLPSGAGTRFEATAARWDGGRWIFGRVLTSPTQGSGASFGTYPHGLTTVAEGHPLALVAELLSVPDAQAHAYDLSTDPATLVAPGVYSSAPGGAHIPLDWVARSPRDFTVWGAEVYSTDTGSRTRGWCRRYGHGAPCRPTAWPVTAVTALPDGRTVLGGRQEGDTAARYAVAAPGKTPREVPGSAGQITVDLVTEPDTTTVWSIGETGPTTEVQRADLGTPRPQPLPRPTPWRPHY